MNRKNLTSWALAPWAFALSMLLVLASSFATAQSRPIMPVPTGTGIPHVVSGAPVSTASAIDLTADVTNSLPATNGGTGLTTALISTGAYSSRPAAGSAGRMYVPTDGGPLWFDTGSAWKGVYNGLIATQPPLVSAFSWTNQGAWTATDNVGRLVMSGVAVTGTSNLRILSRSGGTTAVAGAMMSNTGVIAATGRYLTWGALLRESGTGKICTARYVQDTTSANANHYFVWERWTSATASGASTNAYAIPPGGNVVIRVQVNGSNIEFAWSRDAINFSLLGTIAKTTCFTTAPNQSGIVATAENGTDITNTVVFFHYTDS